MFVLYLVRTSNDFAAYSTASNMKSPHKSPTTLSFIIPYTFDYKV